MSPTKNKFDQFLENTFQSDGAEGLTQCFQFLYGAFVITQDGVVIAANNAFVELIEYSYSELLGMKAFDLITKDEHEAMITRFAEDDNSRYELKLLPKSKKVKYVVVSPKVFEAGGNKYRLAEFFDITQQKHEDQRIIDSEEKFHSIFDQAAVGIARVSPDGKFLEANQALCDIVGYTNKELLKKTFRELTYYEDLNNELNMINDVLDGKKESYNIEKRYIHKNGSLVWANLHSSLIRSNDNKVKYAVAIIEDISYRKKIEQRLNDSEQKFHSIFEQAAVGIARVAVDGSFLEVNQKLCDIVGYTKKELIKKTFQEITHPDDLDEDLKLVDELIDDKRETYNIEKRYFHKNGSIIWVNLTKSLVKSENNEIKYAVSILEDISSRKHIEMQLIDQATHDPLTGLDNRQTLDREIAIELKRAKRYNRELSFVMIDIDHFKYVNDTYGHLAGDQVLKELAIIFQQTIRDSDIVGRFGGEEFLLVLPEIDLKKAIDLAERIRRKIESHTIYFNDKKINVTISLGLSDYPQNGDNLEELIKTCDDAMYEAKENGRNQLKLAK